MADMDTGHTAKQPYWASMNEPGGSYSGHSLRARASSRNGERDLHSVNFAHMMLASLSSRRRVSS